MGPPGSTVWCTAVVVAARGVYAPHNWVWWPVCVRASCSFAAHVVVIMGSTLPHPQYTLLLSRINNHSLHGVVAHPKKNGGVVCPSVRHPPPPREGGGGVRTRPVHILGGGKDDDSPSCMWPIPHQHRAVVQTRAGRGHGCQRKKTLCVYVTMVKAFYFLLPTPTTHNQSHLSVRV